MSINKLKCLLVITLATGSFGIVSATEVPDHDPIPVDIHSMMLPQASSKGIEKASNAVSENAEDKNGIPLPSISSGGAGTPQGNELE